MIRESLISFKPNLITSFIRIRYKW